MVEIFGQDIDPKAFAFGGLSALICLIVTKSVEIPFIWKAATVVLGFVTGTIYTNYQINKG